MENNFTKNTKKVGIYKITCTANNKIYIGSSSNIYQRWHRHKSNFRLNVANKNIQNSYNKYGNDTFLFEIIEECLVDSLIEREQYWFDFYKANGCDLPVTLGFHPWIARNIGKGGSAEINFQAKKMFKRGDDFLPVGELIDPLPQPWDDTFTEIIGTPEIIWPGAAQITLDSDSDYFMIYSQDEEGICFEPVTAPPDAQNLGFKANQNQIGPRCLFGVPGFGIRLRNR